MILVLVVDTAFPATHLTNNKSTYFTSASPTLKLTLHLNSEAYLTVFDPSVWDPTELVSLKMQGGLVGRGGQAARGLQSSKTVKTKALG